jgi:MFS family permease
MMYDEYFILRYNNHTYHPFRYGYDAGVLGGILSHPPFLQAMGNPTDDWTIPMISSSYTLAACVTSLFVTSFSFRIGRRGCIIIGCGGAIIGAAIQSSSYGVPQIIVGRLVTVWQLQST